MVSHGLPPLQFPPLVQPRYPLPPPHKLLKPIPHHPHPSSLHAEDILTYSDNHKPTALQYKDDPYEAQNYVRMLLINLRQGGIFVIWLFL